MKKLISIFCVFTLLLSQIMFTSCIHSPSLKEAVVYDSYSLCHELINNGSDPNEFSPLEFGRTDERHKEWNPLRVSMFLASLNAFDALLEGGADPNALDCDGYPLLHYAVQSNDTEMVDKLIEYGADIHALSLKNTSILDACVGSEYISSGFHSQGNMGVILMFDHLIDIGAIPTNGLLESTIKDQSLNFNLLTRVYDVMKEFNCLPEDNSILFKLLSGDNDITFSGEAGESITGNDILYVAAFGTLSQYKRMISDIGDDKIDLLLEEHYLTRLDAAASTGNTEIVKHIYPDTTISEIENALLYAVEYSHYDTVEELLSSSGITSFRLLDFNYGVWNCYSLASKNEDIEMLNTLSDYVDPSPYLPAIISVAASYNKIQSMEWAVRHGADINDDSYQDMTPIQQAAMSNSSEAVSWLIDAGADALFGSDFSDPPLVLAVSHVSNEKLFDSLLECTDVFYDDIGTKTLYMAVVNGNEHAVSALMQMGVQPNENTLEAIRYSSEAIRELVS